MSPEAELAEATLDACPFCGSAAKLAFDYQPDDDGSFFGGLWVECAACACQLGRGSPDSQECDIGVFGTPGEAVAAWNARAQQGDSYDS